MITLVVSRWQAEKKEELIALFQKNLPQLKSLNININKQKGNTIMGKKTLCIWGTPQIEEQLGNLSFLISPRSFFQVNTMQTQVLYEQVIRLAKLDGNQTVFDLFCGTGTIGLFLAPQAKKVIGIELIADAVADGEKNAQRNAIHNIEFYCGKAEKIMGDLIKNGCIPDLVVLDPPRKGIDKHIIDYIDEYQVPKVVYVSCNPATLARDVKVFIEKGYKLDVVQPVDLFCHTGHVETVVLMSKVR